MAGYEPFIPPLGPRSHHAPEMPINAEGIMTAHQSVHYGERRNVSENERASAGPASLESWLKRLWHS
jgi:hypothetical protein